MAVLKVHKLRSDASLPRYATEGAAGMDLSAALDEPITLSPGKSVAVPTGLVIELPKGFEGQVRPRSGLAAKHRLTVLNAPGTIDQDYRGEVRVLLINLGEADFTIRHGERIAQLIVAPVSRPELQEVTSANDLALTSRGEGGFGSTGM